MADETKVLIAEKNGIELQYSEEYPLDGENIRYEGSSPESIKEIVDNLSATAAVSASPGFSFGRNGSVSAGTWLRRPGNVPSNRAGVTIPIENPIIREVSCSNRNIDTYTLEIYEHEGNLVNDVLLGSVTVTGARGGTFSVNFAATKGKQIAVRLASGGGSVRDLGADIVIKGSTS